MNKRKIHGYVLIETGKDAADCVDVSDILYLKVTNDGMSVRTVKKEYNLDATIEEVFENSELKGFLRISPTCIVNPKWLDYRHGNTFAFSNGMKLNVEDCDWEMSDGEMTTIDNKIIVQ